MSLHFRECDLRVIRPLVYVREKELRSFAEKVMLNYSNTKLVPDKDRCQAKVCSVFRQTFFIFQPECLLPQNQSSSGLRNY